VDGDAPRRNAREAPISIYELHVGSWRRVPEERFRSLSYRELAGVLPEYVAAQGFTHVELMPVMEHPFFGSWGYQSTGYFAPASRYGTPQDFMALVDALHRAGVGVILDWVPSHFATDAHGLGYFDGTHLYEHGDPRQGFHPDWKSFVFNYGRHDSSFLLSSALLARPVPRRRRAGMWWRRCQIRHSRWPGSGCPGRVRRARDLRRRLPRRLNAEVYGHHLMVDYAESRLPADYPPTDRGLGFASGTYGCTTDSISRARPGAPQVPPRQPDLPHAERVDENFRAAARTTRRWSGIVARGQDAGDAGQAANRRPFGYQYTQPGKKSCSWAASSQWSEWNHDAELDWRLDSPAQQGVQRQLRDPNTIYRAEPALHARDQTRRLDR
jgi:1,4-alpha-glucan branching enzyme